MTDDQRARTARAAAAAGGAVAADLFRSDLDVERKDGKTDLVTRADREAEQVVLGRIHEDYDEPIVAEESAGDVSVPEEGPAWVVDPIDGTNNFVRGIPFWGTAVAATVDGDPVAAAVEVPAFDDTYFADGDSVRWNDEPITVSDRSDPETMAVAPTIWWTFDRRDEYAAAAREIVERFGDLVRFRAAQPTLSMVAAGSLDATFTNLRPHPWDAVAGAFLVEQAGGTVTGLDGERWRHDSDGLVASNGERHDEVLAAARAVEDVAQQE